MEVTFVVRRLYHNTRDLKEEGNASDRGVYLVGGGCLLNAFVPLQDEKKASYTWPVREAIIMLI